MSEPGNRGPAGVLPVAATAFAEDGTLDRTSFRRGIEHVLAAGASGVMFPGFASEFYKLDDDETEVLTTDLLATTGQEVGTTAVVSVTDHATVVASRRAGRLVEAGADALNLLPPRSAALTGAALHDHVAAVLAAAAPVPVVVQYAPAETGSAVTPAQLATLAREHPNLAAVKVETQPPGRYIAELSGQDPGLPSLVGNAGLYLLDALRHGAVGVQPGGSFVELYVRLWTSWTGGDAPAAEGLYRRMLEYLLGWARNPETVVAVEKHIAYRRGLVATPHCRAPHATLTSGDHDAIERFMREFADPVGG